MDWDLALGWRYKSDNESEATKRENDNKSNTTKVENNKVKDLTLNHCNVEHSPE